jgi:hypothetical protein
VEDRVKVQLQVGQTWEYRAGVGQILDLYLIIELNADGTAQLVDLRSLEHFWNVRVSHSVDPRHGWRILA